MLPFALHGIINRLNRTPIMDKHEHHHDGKRVEDFRLITGTGKYAADWKTPGQLYAHFVRSDHAHAEILSVNATRALAHPGVTVIAWREVQHGVSVGLLKIID